MPATGKIWERMTYKGETPTAYESFLIYRDIGTTRTIDAAFQLRQQAQDGSEGGAIKRPSGRWFATASRFKWTERASAWDAHLQERRDRVAADFAAKWEVRRLQAVDRTWAMADTLEERVKKLLAYPTTTQKTSRDGQTIHIYPARWSDQSVALMVKTICELRALALGATTRPVGEYSDAELKAIRDAHDVPEADGEGDGPDPG